MKTARIALVYLIFPVSDKDILSGLVKKDIC